MACAKILKYFKLEERNSTVATEIRAGFVTFFTMAYILAVNPRVIAETGGPCVEMDDPGERNECLDNLELDLITATAASACVGSLVMGLFANLPHGLAPGMGMNFYFAYSVVGFEGSGPVSYKTALAAVFLEGIVFIILALTGIRLYLAKLIPNHIKQSTSVGIGLFIALIGCGVAEGIGIVVSDPATGLTLGGCGHVIKTRTETIYQTAKGVSISGKDFYCGNSGGFCSGPGFMSSDFFISCDYNGYVMQGATTWIGILGFVMICVLTMYKVKGGVMIAIMFISFLSWFKGTSISYFPDGESDKFDYFKQVVDFHPIKYTGFQLDFNADEIGQFVLAFFTFLYVDIFDTTGTLYSMTEVAGLLEEDGNFEGSTAAFTADAFGTVAGSLMGISPVTTYIESGAGILEGGKTGLTALTIALLFFISIFFAPILASIPPWASGGALIYVGCMMARSVEKIDWQNPREAIPSAVTMFMMPFTYSIAYGIISGLVLSYLFELVDFITYKTCKCGPKMDEENKLNEIGMNDTTIQNKTGADEDL